MPNQLRVEETQILKTRESGLHKLCNKGHETEDSQPQPNPNFLSAQLNNSQESQVPNPLNFSFLDPLHSIIPYSIASYSYQSVQPPPTDISQSLLLYKYHTCPVLHAPHAPRKTPPQAPFKTACHHEQRRSKPISPSSYLSINFLSSPLLTSLHTSRIAVEHTCLIEAHTF